MTTSTARTTATTRRRARTGLVLRILGALSLGYSAWLHYDLSRDAPLFSDGAFTLMGLFLAQAVAGAVVSLWVLVLHSREPFSSWELLVRRIAWTAFGLVAVGSVAALVISSVVSIPAVGPMPAIYDPLWYSEKIQAAVSAGMASVVAAVALLHLARAARR